MEPFGHFFSLYKDAERSSGAQSVYNYRCWATGHHTLSCNLGKPDSIPLDPLGMCEMKLSIHSQTSMVVPLIFLQWISNLIPHFAMSVINYPY